MGTLTLRFCILFYLVLPCRHPQTSSPGYAYGLSNGQYHNIHLLHVLFQWHQGKKELYLWHISIVFVLIVVQGSARVWFTGSRLLVTQIGLLSSRYLIHFFRNTHLQNVYRLQDESELQLGDGVSSKNGVIVSVLKISINEIDYSKKEVVGSNPARLACGEFFSADTWKALSKQCISK